MSIALADIKAYMLANSGDYPSDATARIQAAVLAQQVGRVEIAVRQQIMADFLKIQAAG